MFSPSLKPPRRRLRTVVGVSAMAIIAAGLSNSGYGATDPNKGFSGQFGCSCTTKKKLK